MKRKFGLIFALLLVIAFAVTAFGCTTSNIDYANIEEITVDEESIGEGFFIDEFDVSKIILNVKYFDTELNGNTVPGEVVQLPVSMSMIKAEDKAKLSVPGTHTINIIYGKFELSCTIVLYSTNVPRYRVVFTDEDGTVLPVINGTINGNSQFVEEGGRAIAPTLPSKAGYSFRGWKDRDTDSMASYDNITKNTTFVAVYVKDAYSVSYYTKVDGKETEIGKANVPYGANALDYAPAIPTIVGYSNGRWENENSMKNVTSDGLKFYAIYDHDQVAVGFIYKRFSANEENYSSLYNVGSTIQNPPAAEIQDFKFVEWRVNGKKATFPYTVTSETVFNAYYIPISEGNAGLRYETNADPNGVTVSEYVGTERIVVIPENVSINGVIYNVTDIKKGVFADHEIDEYVVSDTNQYFITEDGILYNRLKTEVIAYPSAKLGDKYTLLDTVTAIGPYAFYGSDLQSVVLHDNLLTIGERAFSECASLTSINIPRGVTSIGNYAFALSEGGALVAVTFANNSVLSEIGTGAFEGVELLESIALPASLTTLGKGVFAGCKSLATVTALNSTYFTVYNGALYSFDYTTLYLYPALYMNANNPNFVVDSRCENIATGAFSYARITGITVNNALMTLEDYSIDCPSLKYFRTTYDTLTFGTTSFGINIPTDFFIPTGADALYNELSNTYEGTLCWEYESDPLVIKDYYNGYAYESYSITVVENGADVVKEGVKVLGAKSSEDTLEIPNTLNSASVIAIADKAFYGDINIEKVYLPAGLIEVGEQAFYGCKNLRYVSLSNVVNVIKDEAFAECKNLTQVAAPDDLESVADFGIDVFKNTPYYDSSTETFLTVGNVLVKYNGYLTSVTIPASVSYIASDAFKDKGEITELTFEGTGLKIIDSYAFQNCSGLVELTFPSSLTAIKENAFYGCDMIFAVTYKTSSDNASLAVDTNAFGNRVTPVYSVFSNTTNYTLTYQIDSDYSSNYVGVVVITPYEVENTAVKRFDGWYLENTYVTLATFPMILEDNIVLYAKKIDAGASTDGLVYNYDADTDSYVISTYNGTDEYVIVPSDYKNGKKIRSIAEGAFRNKDVRYIELPFTKNQDGSISSNITKIGENAFLGTPWYENYNGDFVMIDDILIRYTGRSKVVYIPEGVRTLADGAFRGATYVETVVFPEGVDDISDNAFYGCTGLTTVVLPAGLSTIGYHAFYGCTKLSNINFEDSAGLSTIGYDAFDNTYWLDNYAADCVMINDILFRYNPSTAVTALHIYNGVIMIGERAFYGNETLQTIFIPQSVGYVGESAFEDCAVTEVKLFAGGSNLISIGDKAFNNCNRLTAIDLSLASKLVYIGEKAFNGCSALTKISIPATLTEMGAYAFEGSGLNSVVFASGSKLAIIPEGAFKNCLSLFSVNFSGSSALKEIKAEAFYYCSSLRDFNNSNGSLAKIGARAFYNCANLRNFNVNSNTLQEIGDLALENVGYVVSSSSNMVVLGNILIKYNGFESVVTIPANITTIYNGAFRGNTRITDIIFPANSAIKNINSNAFAGCASLANINFPDSIKFVGDDVVTGTEWYATKIRSGEELITISNTLIKYNATKLQQVVLPEYVETINAGAFDGASFYDIVIGSNLSTIQDGAFDGVDTVAYHDWTITISRNTPPALNYADTSIITAYKIIMPSFDVMDVFRMDSVWGELYDKMTVPNRVTVNFQVDDAVTSHRNNVNAIYSEISAIANNDDGKTYIFIGWYYDDARTQKVVYPLIISDNMVGYSDAVVDYIVDTDNGPVLTLYAKFIDNEEGSNSNLYAVNLDTHTINRYLVQYDGQGNPIEGDAKIIVIGEKSEVTMTTIGQGYEVDEEGDYIYNEGNYVLDDHTPNVTRYSKYGAFEGHTELKEVYFTANSAITTIGENAFKGCTSLEKIVLPASVTSIAGGAFEGCTSLREVVFLTGSEDLTISSGAFKNCTSLRSITLPERVKGLGNGAFEGCTALIDVYMESSTAIVLEADARPFPFNVGLVIHIPSDAYNSYASTWEEYDPYLNAEEE